ncbi:MAG: hypothetical protein Q9207_006915 [Kuettlingeria erythrocarpa]
MANATPLNIRSAWELIERTAEEVLASGQEKQTIRSANFAYHFCQLGVRGGTYTVHDMLLHLTVNRMEYFRYWEECREAQRLRDQVSARLEEAYPGLDVLAVDFWHQQLRHVLRKICKGLEELKGLQDEFARASVKSGTDFDTARFYLNRAFQRWHDRRR